MRAQRVDAPCAPQQSAGHIVLHVERPKGAGGSRSMALRAWGREQKAKIRRVVLGKDYHEHSEWTHLVPRNSPRGTLSSLSSDRRERAVKPLIFYETLWSLDA